MHLRHLKRREEGTLLNKTCRGNIGGRRSRANTEEDIEDYLREMGIRVWSRKTQGRSEWATLVRQALALHGS